jgi:hypothetical protein
LPSARPAILARPARRPISGIVQFGHTTTPSRRRRRG